MYVLIIARGYPSEQYPLNGLFEFDQAKALARQGCKIIYAAVDVRSVRWRRKLGLEQRNIDGVKVYAINIPCGGRPEALRSSLEFRGLEYLYRLIEKQEGRPDLMHAHFFILGYQAAKLKKEVGLPLVVTEHSSMITDRSINAKEIYKANFAYESADQVVAVSPYLQSVLAEQFKVNAKYIPNMYDPTVFYYREMKRNDSFQFISVGSLISRKRMTLIINAFQKIVKTKNNLRLTICGEGHERKHLEAMITANKLDNLVELCGYQPREKIADKMRKSDCFILASCSEPFGVVYIEALACGLPVIATKCGGPEVFVNKSKGVLVPVDDSEALAEAMLYMASNSDQYEREKIALDTRQEFGPQVVAKELIELYKVVKHEKA